MRYEVRYYLKGAKDVFDGELFVTYDEAKAYMLTLMGGDFCRIEIVDVLQDAIVCARLA